MTWWQIALIALGVIIGIIIIFAILSRMGGNNSDSLDSRIGSVRNSFDSVCKKISNLFGC